MRYSTSKFLGFDLDFRPLKVTWRQKCFRYLKAIRDFLSNFRWHFLFISFRSWDIWLQSFRVRPWLSTLKSHVTSKMSSLFESLYMTSYLTSIDTFSLSRSVPEIFDLKDFWVYLELWPWNRPLKGHVRSKKISPFESPCMTSYLTSINTFSLSRTVPQIFDFKVLGFDLDFRPLKVTWRQIFFRYSESPYMTSYLTSIETFSLSRTVPEIFDFKVFRVRPLTFDP